MKKCIAEIRGIIFTDPCITFCGNVKYIEDKNYTYTTCDLKFYARHNELCEECVSEFIKVLKMDIAE